MMIEAKNCFFLFDRLLLFYMKYCRSACSGVLRKRLTHFVRIDALIRTCMRAILQQQFQKLSGHGRVEAITFLIVL